MSAFISELRPERWKLFQCLYIDGENSGRVEHLLVTKEVRVFSSRCMLHAMTGGDRNSTLSLRDMSI